MSYLKCTCQHNYNYRNTDQKQRQFTEDPALLEKLRERQLELEELNLEFEHRLGNLNRENDLLQEKIKLENQEYRECQTMRNNLTVEMRNYKLLSFKKSQELQMLIQNVHELEADKKMNQNEVEYLKQLLLHDNENIQQLQKKEEHIKLLENRLQDLEQSILQSKRNMLSQQSGANYQGY